MKTIPNWILIVATTVAFLVAANSLLPFWERLNEIHKHYSSGKITEDSLRSEYATAYVTTIGESAGRQFTSFFLLTILIGLAAEKCEKWVLKIFPVALLGVIFYLSTYTFILSDEVLEFIDSGDKIKILDLIIKSKIAAAALALFSGGFLYDCGKALFKEQRA